ncbi:hypothetical protein BGZ96_001589 [Linnemannia gamsii]|uniref:PH domain-containing protein n=1 Tax=Linnemannia gamsii TaxID=64522 RepID=A0ABQ7K9T4_9FUNG|nr:hypothetical protein BGZ96_001589 [Linnemannia gamsii]
MAQNADTDMDFEKMMGELAAMKTDLANRQANRFGSRPTTPRDAEQEPRRTRLTRAKTETRANTSLTVETATLDPTVSSHPSAVLSPTKRSATAGVSLRDPEGRLNARHRPTQDRTTDSNSNEQARMRIDAAIPETSTTPSQASDAADPGSSINDAVETIGPLPGGLVRRESKRAMPVPLPPKSAQRSRSISHGSGRPPQTVDENGERVVNGSESTQSTPQETSTAVFDGPVPPRKFLRPYPSSPSLSSSVQNGQMMPASPRVPARSNSRNYAKSPRPIPGSPSITGSPSIPEQSSQGSPYDQQYHQQQQQQPLQQQQHQYQYHHQQGPQSPVVPPRSRSASKSLSRSNTLTKTDVKHDDFPFMATPSIAEDRETLLSPQEPPLLPPAIEQFQPPQQPQQFLEEQEQASVKPQPQQQELVQPQPVQPQQQQPQQQEEEAQQQEEEAQQQQQPIVASEEALQRGVADSPIGAGAIQKKSSSDSLGHGDEGNESEAAHSLAPSLLPAHSIPTRQASSQGDNEYHDGRPILRKQKSVDPAAIYRQHQQEAPMRDRLPSRHASERRPNRDRNPSNTGFANPSESGRSREPSGAGETQNEPERGRKQKSDEGSSKGGMFAWVRSRSKSRDASHAKPNYETSHPVPESTYPEYNPALIPSRSTGALGSQRSKSLPRKASNPNFQAESGGWPPVPQAGLNGDPAASLHHRSKSTSKFARNPPPFASSTGGPSDTNKNTMHHENMIRGMGMGSTPISPAVLLTPQPSFPTTQSSLSGGGMRGMALAMMKDDNSPSSSDQQMQQRQLQLQQAQQMQHLQQQQQRLAASLANGSSPPDSPSGTNQSSNAQQTPMSPTGATAGAVNQATTQRLVATRIYIQTEIDFKSVNLAPNSTALDALHMLQERGVFGQPGDGRYHDRWTIFEYSKEFLIERPLRDFEVILDVMKTWEADKDNKMICKPFPARNELTAQEVVRLVGPAGQESFVRPHGWVHVEMKKGKWVKRYLHINDTAVYHSKDAKFNGESMLCLLRNFDVYAVQVPRKKAPTKFGFALKSSDKIHLFETPEDDYIHYVCTDSGESLREWLAGLRAAKGIFMYHANPEVIREGQKHAELLSSGSQDGPARGNLTEEQVSIAEAKLAGWGMLNSSMSVPGNRTR